MLALRNSEIIPFPYQSECLEVLTTVEKTQNAALVVMAGGLGKTILSALNVKRRFNTFGESRCLFLGYQNDVLEQAEIDYRKVFKNEVTYGFFHGEEKSNFRANIIFASFQTMRENLDFYTRQDFDIIVVDESHHSMAETYEKVIRYFIPKFLLGITMIPDRLDGLDIREIYGKEVYSITVVDALARGLLCPVDYRMMTDEIGSLKRLKTKHGRLSIRLLNRTIFIPKRDEEIAEIIKSQIKALDNPRAMIFCSSIEHAEILASMIPGSIPLHSGISKVERKVRLELFRNGSFKAAICVDMFNESLNIREANLIVFLRLTASPNIFYNQLARGLRLFPGKDKVIVLDFVANCERALAVYELWAKVKTEREQLLATIQKEIKLPQRKSEISKSKSIMTSPSVKMQKVQKDSIEPFSLNVEDVEFQEKIIPIIAMIRKIREGFYETWEEASGAAIKLGIVSQTDYNAKYKKDSKLVSLPRLYYENFPGWYIFLSKEKKDFYGTWQEASKAAIKLGIKDGVEYDAKYKQDPKLPRAPENYKNFPNWFTFLGKEIPPNKYLTWQEASKAAVKLGIRNFDEYMAKRELDPKLPASPHSFYLNFPGLVTFLEKYYRTWEEAGKAALKVGITSGEDYKKRYQNDPKLVSSPDSYYEDFPGWHKFLGKEKPVEKYTTWTEASKAIKKLKIKTSTEYRRRYKEDPKLPSDLAWTYKDFPGW
jgi:superfamily II DNA or RNA helicase